MITPAPATSAAARYDRALRKAHDRNLPPGSPRPQPTPAWPAENVALLEQYQTWLLTSGASPAVVAVLAIPMAGHALGLTLKPYLQLDLDADLDRALAYVLAKHPGPVWAKNCRNALGKFRRFLRHQRGQVRVDLRPLHLAPYTAGLPDWLVQGLHRYQHLRQRNWRPARLHEEIRAFWSGHTRLWRWLFAHYPIITTVADLRRQHLLAYADSRLAAGRTASGVNGELRSFRSFLLFLQDQDERIPQALLRLPGLKQPDSLPRFLTDEQVRRLHADLDARFAQAERLAQRRDAALDRALFHLLWQGGLRRGEAEELRLEDLDRSARRLIVRRGKGNKDRTVYLTERALAALEDYLALRGPGPTSHVFLYRNEPICKDLIASRIKATGDRTGVKVSPHGLRHTYATQLLNAGCRVTSIQQLLGHRRLNSTMIYARVHDQTVADDYFAAMARIEDRLDLVPPPDPGQPLPSDGHRPQLLELTARLAEPELGVEARLALVAELRRLLDEVAPMPEVPALVAALSP